MDLGTVLIHRPTSPSAIFIGIIVGVMALFAFPIEYFVWHYGEGLRDFFRVFGNFLWAVYNFFSIPLLLRTFFMPWRRLQEEKKQQGFHAEEFFGNIIVNIIMRLVGMLVRLVTLIIGAAIIIIIFCASIVSLVVWLTLPLVVAVLFVFGLTLIINS